MHDLRKKRGLRQKIGTHNSTTFIINPHPKLVQLFLPSRKFGGQITSALPIGANVLGFVLKETHKRIQIVINYYRYGFWAVGDGGPQLLQVRAIGHA